MDLNRIEELQRTRFPTLPLDCGCAVPTVVDDESQVNWTGEGSTTDQLRIEDYIDQFDLTGLKLLHIGLGNSALARRFAGRVAGIVGTTISPPELTLADHFKLPNYKTCLHNKHAGSDGTVVGHFDFVIDNNPTSFACCLRHLFAMLEFYASVLDEDGQFVTDQLGLGWVIDSPQANPRWSFSFSDFAACAPLVGLAAWKFDRNIYVLSKSQPKDPPLSARPLYLFRRFKREIQLLRGILIERLRR